MAFDYASLASDVGAILAEFGATGTLTRNTPGTYDPTAGEVATTTTTQTVTACLFPYGDKFIDGTQILANDRQAFIGASGITGPRAGDVLTWGTETLTVVKVKALAPARTYVIYECQMRAAGV